MNPVIRRLSLLAFLAAAALVFAGVASAQTASHSKQLVQHVRLVIKSDDQHGKLGPTASGTTPSCPPTSRSRPAPR